MTRDNKLERMVAKKKHSKAYWDGFFTPLKIPYNIGSIEIEESSSGTVKENMWKTVGLVIGTAFGFGQLGLYGWAISKGYSEVLAAPVGFSVYNYCLNKYNNSK